MTIVRSSLSPAALSSSRSSAGEDADGWRGAGKAFPLSGDSSSDSLSVMDRRTDSGSGVRRILSLLSLPAFEF